MLTFKRIRDQQILNSQQEEAPIMTNEDENNNSAIILEIEEDPYPAQVANNPSLLPPLRVDSPKPRSKTTVTLKYSEFLDFDNIEGIDDIEDEQVEVDALLESEEKKKQAQDGSRENADANMVDIDDDNRSVGALYDPNISPNLGEFDDQYADRSQHSNEEFASSERLLERGSDNSSDTEVPDDEFSLNDNMAYHQSNNDQNTRAPLRAEEELYDLRFRRTPQNEAENPGFAEEIAARFPGFRSENLHMPDGFHGRRIVSDPTNGELALYASGSSHEHLDQNAALQYHGPDGLVDLQAQQEMSMQPQQQIPANRINLQDVSGIMGLDPSLDESFEAWVNDPNFPNGPLPEGLAAHLAGMNVHNDQNPAAFGDQSNDMNPVDAAEPLGFGDQSNEMGFPNDQNQNAFEGQSNDMNAANAAVSMGFGDQSNDMAFPNNPNQNAFGDQSNDMNAANPPFPIAFGDGLGGQSLPIDGANASGEQSDKMNLPNAQFPIKFGQNAFEPFSPNFQEQGQFDNFDVPSQNPFTNHLNGMNIPHHPAPRALVAPVARMTARDDDFGPIDPALLRTLIPSWNNEDNATPWVPPSARPFAQDNSLNLDNNDSDSLSENRQNYASSFGDDVVGPQYPNFQRRFMGSDSNVGGMASSTFPTLRDNAAGPRSNLQGEGQASDIVSGPHPEQEQYDEGQGFDSLIDNRLHLAQQHGGQQSFLQQSPNPFGNGENMQYPHENNGDDLQLEANVSDILHNATFRRPRAFTAPADLASLFTMEIEEVEEVEEPIDLKKQDAKGLQFVKFMRERGIPATLMPFPGLEPGFQAFLVLEATSRATGKTVAEMWGMPPREVHPEARELQLPSYGCDRFNAVLSPEEQAKDAAAFWAGPRIIVEPVIKESEVFDELPNEEPAVLGEPANEKSTVSDEPDEEGRIWPEVDMPPYEKLLRPFSRVRHSDSELMSMEELDASWDAFENKEGHTNEVFFDHDSGHFSRSPRSMSLSPTAVQRILDQLEGRSNNDAVEQNPENPVQESMEGIITVNDDDDPDSMPQSVNEGGEEPPPKRPRISGEFDSSMEMDISTSTDSPEVSSESKAKTPEVIKTINTPRVVDQTSINREPSSVASDASFATAVSDISPRKEAEASNSKYQLKPASKGKRTSDVFALVRGRDEAKSMSRVPASSKWSWGGTESIGVAQRRKITPLAPRSGMPKITSESRPADNGSGPAFGINQGNIHNQQIMLPPPSPGAQTSPRSGTFDNSAEPVYGMYQNHPHHQTMSPTRSRGAQASSGNRSFGHNARLVYGHMDPSYFHQQAMNSPSTMASWPSPGSPGTMSFGGGVSPVYGHMSQSNSYYQQQTMQGSQTPGSQAFRHHRSSSADGFSPAYGHMNRTNPHYQQQTMQRSPTPSPRPSRHNRSASAGSFSPAHGRMDQGNSRQQTMMGPYGTGVHSAQGNLFSFGDDINPHHSQMNPNSQQQQGSPIPVITFTGRADPEPSPYHEPTTPSNTPSQPPSHASSPVYTNPRRPSTPTDFNFMTPTTRRLNFGTPTPQKAKSETVELRYKTRQMRQQDHNKLESILRKRPEDKEKYMMRADFDEQSKSLKVHGPMGGNVRGWVLGKLGRRDGEVEIKISVD